ncbi:MAG TPA: sucrose phosphorylase [Candidatus Limnocylindria bacterium]|nr:sucrose phosphorylase [Candidatus Limnocylindria bacterium]
MTDAREIAPRPQLLTYPDSLGGNLPAIAALLEGPLAGAFTGAHILPPFPSSGDRGFAPITYAEIDPRFGTWADIERIGRTHDVVLDVMINHLSRQSPEFRDFARRGRASAYADLFITLDKVWPDGKVPPEDLARIFLRRPVDPFTKVEIEETGETETVWATFGTADWSEQIDLDVRSPATRELITSWLRGFAEHRVRIVRLDAIGYVIKKPGTSCFMVEPEIWEFIGWITDVAARHGLAVLPEVHDRYTTHQRLTAHGAWTYDFVQPGLVLDTFRTGDPRRLAEHLARSPHRQFTMLDCHDGIPIRPDLDGILPPDDMRALADHAIARGGNVSRILSPAHAGDVDVHQLNITYRAALDGDDDRTVAARAIQLFSRGVPQVYYVGLLAGDNDPDAVRATGDGREINRHNYTDAEIAAALDRDVVQRLLRLVRLRNTHPAFAGELSVEADASVLRQTWTHGREKLALEVEPATGLARIREGAGQPAPV